MNDRMTSRTESSQDQPHGVDRRTFMASMSAMGLGATAFPAALWGRVQGEQGGQEAQEAQDAPITAEMISAAEKLAGLEFTNEEREMMLQGLNRSLRGYASLREVSIPNDVAPAIRFDPVLPGQSFPSESTVFEYTRPRGIERPGNLEEVAFWPVTHLAELVKGLVDTVDLAYFAVMIGVFLVLTKTSVESIRWR